MKKIEELNDNGFNAKLKALIKEHIPNHKINKIQLAESDCENGHWEVVEYVENGEVKRVIEWVCD